MAYPALRTTKEDDNVDFSFLRRQLFTSDQAEALEREIFLSRSVRSALSAECLSTPRIVFANKTQEGNVKAPFIAQQLNSTRRPVGRRSSVVLKISEPPTIVGEAKV